MRYGAIPENPLEFLALRLGLIPEALIDAMYPLMLVRSIMAGVKLGVFESLRDGPLDSREVASRCSLNPAATESLARTLALARYLKRRRDGRYELTARARRHLVSGAPADLRGLLLWNYTQWRLVEGMEDAVRTGRGVDFHARLQEPDAWAHYQRAMMELAREDAPFVARKTPLPEPAARLLDVGGSHGLFAAAFARRAPGLRCEVLDLPQAVSHARALAESEGHSSGLTFREGDLTRLAWGAGWDIVLLCNVLHHFDEPLVRELLVRAAAALRPGGVAAIWDIERPARDAAVRDGDGADLFFRLTSTSGTWSAEEYEAWLRAAGFGAVSLRRALHRPGMLLVTAVAGGGPGR